LTGGVEFIGSHPLAGSDLGGFEHADPRLFEGEVCVVTPDGATSASALERLTRFWQSLSMRVVQLSPAVHDRALAQTSHLPHVVACALVNALEDSNAPLAASGFRDTTRIAGGDPNIWVPILLENSTEIVSSLDAFGGRLAEFRRAVAARDAETLNRLLERAKSRRERLDPAAD
jgi:prephenate dehydrogenase